MIKNIHKRNGVYWSKLREENTLDLFHKAAEQVPAYKDFLKKHKIDPSSIKTLKDLERVPITNKSNYLRQYPFEKLCWDGSLKKPLVFTSTSGSTGEPFYFCRSDEIDWQSSIVHELFFKNGSYGEDTSTLVIVCFGMGVWIGGIITYQAFEIVGKRGYPVSIITPGINKAEIFKTLKKLAPNFDQVIIAGYAPFVKDILDEAPRHDIKLKDLNIRLMFAAEAFTENFREYLAEKVSAPNMLVDTMNIYGSADIGTMAFETPLSILIRRLAVKRPKLFRDIFSPISKTPTLAQYNPAFINFEAPKGEILLSGNNSLPLVRYSIGDHGGVYSFAQMMDLLARHGISIYREAKKEGISAHLYQLPFVYVYERSDMSTTIYGLQVYPETIREVLLEKPFPKYLTGKLTLATQFDNKQNQYLEINLELQKDKKISGVAERQLSSQILKNLIEKNSEFRELHKFLGVRAIPRLVFWPNEHAQYFKPGIKQRWVKK